METFPGEIWSIIVKKCDYNSQINLAKTCRFLAGIVFDFSKVFVILDQKEDFNSFLCYKQYIKYINITSFFDSKIDLSYFLYLTALHIKNVPIIVSPKSTVYACSPILFILPKSLKYIISTPVERKRKPNGYVLKNYIFAKISNVVNCTKCNCDCTFTVKMWTISSNEREFFRPEAQFKYLGSKIAK